MLQYGFAYHRFKEETEGKYVEPLNLHVFKEGDYIVAPVEHSAVVQFGGKPKPNTEYVLRGLERLGHLTTLCRKTIAGYTAMREVGPIRVNKK